MRVEDLAVGDEYRFPVDSIVGFEDYSYTGKTHPNPRGGLLYCFEGLRGRDGFYWFDANDIKAMRYLTTDRIKRTLYFMEQEKKQEEEHS